MLVDSKEWWPDPVKAPDGSPEEACVIPPNAKLPERNVDIEAWDKLAPEKRELYARLMC